MKTDDEITWVGRTGYVICNDCRKLVRVNKRVLGSLHVCATVCEMRGRHSGPIFNHRRVGPFWNRRDEFRCTDCHTLVPDPSKIRAVAS